MSNRVQEWAKRLAEIAANFVLPGLGGAIFEKKNRKNALWQMLLSLAGMVVAAVGSGIFLAVFLQDNRLRLDEEYVAAVLQDQEALSRIMLGLGGVILGGALILGGFLWSLENAMKRWRSPRALPPEIPDPADKA